VVLCGAVYRTVTSPGRVLERAWERGLTASTLVRVILLVAGAVGLVVALACALSVAPEIDGFGVIRTPGQLPHHVLVAACAMSVSGIGGLCALATGMCLVLVPPVGPRIR
jgi:hypothetical protein